MKRNALQLLFLLATPFLLFTNCNEAPTETNSDTASGPPNIIVLLADDLGYGDLSAYGSQSIHTPNIDALAAAGMKFTRFYAGSAVCSPSRASLLTGKFPLRFDIRQHFDDREMHLPAGTLTFPRVLQQNGYRTAHIGKWHLGGIRIQDFTARTAGEAANPGPLQHGFDHYLCNIEDPLVRPELIRERKLYREGGKTLVRNDRRIDEIPKHWTEIKVDEAINVIEESRKADQPFFVNLWFDVPHTPYEPAPERHLSVYEKMGVKGDQLWFRSMVSHLDEQIGRLIDHLETSGLLENTIIVFTSDNGPAYQGSPGPFKGGKTDLHEGGIRVPMIAVWPNRIPANTYSFQTAHMTDLFPTLSALAGIEVEASDLDGMDLSQHLLEQTPLERGVLLWQMDLYKHFQNQGPKPTPYATTVAMNENWKLLADSLQTTELFDLEADHRELYNQLGQQDSIEQLLHTEMRSFLAAPRKSWKK
ncbi:sulfatase family protein [Flavilitoribacter nigricans]|uniref:Arylsulfatase n=1 Tax=Flavilitoribacter nigricans (strain ATCC 23147 / DSM 23189 / NBRC 102662 / NCIMB 1420 / SS-2) TaxID=1122177 RepID=A0A2D0NBW4_FLAN2|nr:sulfatase-like hydrolase/transferase [Flavilitoribacter nigricans]PHN06002.1 arylsulfatase [Flavilitoribacter nigricans DSM 23189 = NBRC 102662]